MIKFANPFLHKSQNRQSQWFISLFNYLQAETINNKSQKTSKVDENSNEDTIFSHYVRDIIIKNASSVFCFNFISNKMNSNECLTTFKFNSYLLQTSLQPQKIVINLHQLKEQ